MAEKSSVVSTRKAAQMLGVSLRTVQLWVESGVLRAWKTPGNHRRVYLTSVERLLQERGGALPRVLVVEDDPIVQAYYQALFDQVEGGVELDIAGDGFEGLMKVGANKPDLMIVDIDMPYMNGLQMLASLRASDSTDSVEMAIVTGLSEGETVDLDPELQNVPVFAKPLSMDTFLQILALLPDRLRLREATQESNA